MQAFPGHLYAVAGTLPLSSGTVLSFDIMAAMLRLAPLAAVRASLGEVKSLRHSAEPTQQMSTGDADIVSDYETSLSELTVNSKPHINLLTLLADEGRSFAAEIVRIIEARVMQVEPVHKLPLLYLIDSILKNCTGSTYKDHFVKNIISTFVHVFDKGDEEIRGKLYKLRNTWSSIFPLSKLYAIDIKVHAIDPAWPLTISDVPRSAPSAPPPHPSTPAANRATSIHVNPKFLATKQSLVDSKSAIPVTEAAKATTAVDPRQKTLEMLQQQKSQLFAKKRSDVIKATQPFQHSLVRKELPRSQAIVRPVNAALLNAVMEPKALKNQDAKFSRSKSHDAANDNKNVVVVDISKSPVSTFHVKNTVNKPCSDVKLKNDLSKRVVKKSSSKTPPVNVVQTKKARTLNPLATQTPVPPGPAPDPLVKKPSSAPILQPPTPGARIAASIEPGKWRMQDDVHELPPVRPPKAKKPKSLPTPVAQSSAKASGGLNPTTPRERTPPASCLTLSGSQSPATPSLLASPSVRAVEQGSGLEEEDDEDDEVAIVATSRAAAHVTRQPSGGEAFDRKKIASVPSSTGKNSFEKHCLDGDFRRLEPSVRRLQSPHLENPSVKRQSPNGFTGSAPKKGEKGSESSENRINKPLQPSQQPGTSLVRPAALVAGPLGRDPPLPTPRPTPVRLASDVDERLLPHGDTDLRPKQPRSPVKQNPRQPSPSFPLLPLKKRRRNGEEPPDTKKSLAPAPTYSRTRPEAIPVNNCIFVEGKAYGVFYVNETPVIKRDGLLHRLQFIGKGRDVIIDSHTYFLPFDKQLDILVDNKAHRIRFGGPSRELYMGDYPFRGTFGGPPIFATINGVKHKIQLRGPAPEVKIDPEPAYDLMKAEAQQQASVWTTAESRVPLKSYPLIPQAPTALGPSHLSSSLKRQPLLNDPLPSAPMATFNPSAKFHQTGSIPILPGGPSVRFPSVPAAESASLAVGHSQAIFGAGQSGPAPVNVSDLLTRLVSTGIIGLKPTVSTEQQKSTEQTPCSTSRTVYEIDTTIPTSKEPTAALQSFEMRVLRVRYTAVLKGLYHPNRWLCSDCGMRFLETDQQKRAKHQDLHAKQNLLSKMPGKQSSRMWHIASEDWVNYEEYSDEKTPKAKSAVFEQAQKKNEPVLASTNSVITASLEEYNECSVCQEKFEQFWDEDDESWKLRNAVLVNFKAYHPLCYQDTVESNESISDDLTADSSSTKLNENVDLKVL